MKDNLQLYLESICKTQEWAKKQIEKHKIKVEKINIDSISSIKQKLF